MNTTSRHARRILLGVSLLVLALLAPPAAGVDVLGRAPSKASDAVGHWEGYVDGTVVLKLDLASDGTRWAGRAAVPALADPAVSVNGISVPRFGIVIQATFSCPAWGDCEFFGSLRGRDELGGFLRLRGGVAFAVEFRRTRADRPVRPPKEWVAPLPVTYRAEPVGFRSGLLTLAGELTVPSGDGPHPAVILLSGSGATDRDGNRFAGQRLPFYRAIADHLSRRGVAVLRCDDRGIGGSGGNYDDATLQDLADDAVAAAAYLVARPDVRRDRVGVLGFSEGASVAPLACAASPSVAFAVLLAPEAVDGATGELERHRLRMEAAGPAGLMSQSYTEQFELCRVSLPLLVRGLDPVAIRRQLLEAGTFEADKVDAHVEWLGLRGTAYRMRHDADAALSKVRVPVLAVYFGKDDLVPPALNEPALCAAVARGGNPALTVKLFPEYGHSLGPPVPKNAPRFPAEYVVPAEDVLQSISEWVAQLPAAPPG